MAITKCTKCHNTVSDRFPFCPNCGTPIKANSASVQNGDNTQIISDSSSGPNAGAPVPPPQQPPYGNSNPQPYPDWNSEPPKRKNTGLWIVIIALIVAIVLIVLYFTVFSKGSYFTPGEQENTIELQEGNADAENKALLEQQRIKQENLTFTSPDLAFFNLHGHISSIHYTVDGYPIVELLGKTVKLDSNGRWTNTSILGKSAKVERDQNGYITHIFLHTSKTGDKNYYFQWSGGHMSRIEFYDNENSSNKTVVFHGDRVESKSGETTQVYGCTDNSKTAYSSFKTDQYGNWTSCKWKRTGYEDCGWGQETISKSGHITRSLSYYDSF